jgi:hypothetical protein
LSPTDSNDFNDFNDFHDFNDFRDSVFVENYNYNVLTDNVSDESDAVDNAPVYPVQNVGVDEDFVVSAELIESITIYYQNINRSKTKTAELFLSVIENDYDVIVLVETNFDASIKNEEVFDNRYLVYRCDRILGVNSVKSSGGGIVVAVNKHFRSVQCPVSLNPCEELWVKIAFDDMNLFVCGVYLPQSAPDEFCQRHINSVEQIRLNPL